MKIIWFANLNKFAELNNVLDGRSTKATVLG